MPVETYSWTCPFCNRIATIGEANQSINSHQFNRANKDGDLILSSTAVVCPNLACREYSINMALYHAQHVNPLNGASYYRIDGDPIEVWRLRPLSSYKPFPSYIPKTILDDYREACSILTLSPKASATLSRRCLQGMIRDFWGIKGKTLFVEIEQLKDKLDKSTWLEIDALRTLGNIGAHMEKDINVIVDVEPEEAALLIQLIENLLTEWYIRRQEREERSKALVAAAQKAQVVRNAASGTAAIEAPTNSRNS